MTQNQQPPARSAFPTLSVVVAAFNEEPVIAGNLRQIAAALAGRPGLEWEIVCVDDGSHDATGRLMDEFAREEPKAKALHHRRNFGQGRALRTGFAICRGEVIVTLDADLSYGPEYIARLVDALAENNAEIALASPYMKGGTVRNVPGYRHLLSRIGNWYLARLSHYPISTSTCVVRAYRREVIENLVLTSDGMELQLEVLMKASLAGYTVCEVPAHLEWAPDKVAEADFRRVSKMRILRTVRLYLLMGWIQRPAGIFVGGGAILLLVGLYMAAALTYRFAVFLGTHGGEGPTWAITRAFRDLFEQYSYSVIFCGAFLILGFQILSVALLMMQNKFYFEELCRMMHCIENRTNPCPGQGFEKESL